MLKWTDAKAWCEEKYTGLMVIQNKKEITYLKNHLPVKNSHYWIGLRRMEGQWTWQGTGKRLESSEFWAPNEPNNKTNEECVEMYRNEIKNRNGMWNDDKCSKEKYFLCYTVSCTNVSCGEHGQCVEDIENYTCKCDPGFTGPSCMEAVQCDTVRDPDQGFVNCTHVYGEFRFNSSCHFQCVPGYSVQGSEYLQCLASGKWHSDPPECHVSCTNVSCGEHGQCVEDIENYTCKCDPGFTGPSCMEAVQCDTVRDPDQGFVNCTHVYGEFRFNSSYHFQCVPGYSVQGSEYLQCLASGKWHSDPPECHELNDLSPEPVLCKNLSVPDGGKVECSSTFCMVHCPPSHLLLGTHEYICRSDGSWSHFQPICASYHHLLMASSGCALLSTIFCCVFCWSYCLKRKTNVKPRTQEDMRNSVHDAEEGTQEEQEH
ncbi:L-selectin-like [Trichomycterus rosablanca]|uniref:L-selectin-like n=1 Tax=Trichomycterus rosablanca TaxID=2290929 RepID=UPI002F3563B0